MTMPQSFSPRGPRLLRITLAVALTAYVLWASNPSQLLDAVRAADLGWLAAAVALVFLDRTLMALRWIDLLVALAPGSRPPLTVVLRVFFVSSFVSNFVPSVASDLYRAYALSRYDVHLAESTASVLMDRALGVLSVVIVAAAALPFADGLAGRDRLVAAVALLAAVCAIAAASVFSERAAETVRRAAGLIPLKVLHRVTEALTEAVRRYAKHHTELARVLALSILVQVIRVLQGWCIGTALGLHAPLLTYFVFIPIIVLVMQVPVTPNGIGTTQWIFRELFTNQLGAPAAPVFTFSVLFLSLGILGTLPGAVLYLTDSPTARRRADTT
jgi:uncharacterized protein (TIRG00374 family)